MAKALGFPALGQHVTTSVAQLRREYILLEIACLRLPAGFSEQAGSFIVTVIHNGVGDGYTAVQKRFVRHRLSSPSAFKAQTNFSSHEIKI